VDAEMGRVASGGRVERIQGREVEVSRAAETESEHVVEVNRG
jgi:hypothetical protein